MMKQQTKGLLRHIVTKIGFTTKEVMVVLVATKSEIPHIEEFVEELKEKVEGFKTLVINVNDKKTNVILGRKNINVYGDGRIIDYIGKLKFEISPLSFFQVNPITNPKFYTIRHWNTQT